MKSIRLLTPFVFSIFPLFFASNPFHRILHNREIFLYFFLYVSRAISSRVDLSRNNTIFDYQIPHSQFIETVSARQTEPAQKTMVTSQSKVKKESGESNKRATYQFRLLLHIQ